jgi:predicted component of type VI protein secretion system
VKGTFNSALVAIGLKASQAEKAAKEQAKAAKAFAASLVPRNVDLVIEATLDANGDSEGHGLSTIFRFYALPDDSAFSQLTAVDAADKTLTYQEQVLFPNRISRFRQKFPSDSQFVGVLFQLHNRPHRWKLLIPVNRLQADQPLRVVLGRCDVNVKSGLVPLPNNPLPATPSVSTTVKAMPKIPVSTIESALSAVC